jgi:hypothetical protein
MSIDPKTDPPLRWLHPDSDASPELRTTLYGAAQVEEPASRIARLEQRLLPLFSAPPIATLQELPGPDIAGNSAAAGSTAEGSAVGSLGPSGASAGGALTGGAIAKVVAAVAVVGAVGAGVQTASESNDSRAVAVTRHAKGAAAAAIERTRPALEIPSSPTPSATEPLATTCRPPAHVPPGGQARAAPVSTLNEEAQLLSRARAASPTNVKAALALLMEHAQRFPSGALAQERELYLIELLARSGQTQAAARRLTAFEATAPDSPHLVRARAHVEKGAPIEGAAEPEK